MTSLIISLITSLMTSLITSGDEAKLWQMLKEK